MSQSRSVADIYCPRTTSSITIVIAVWANEAAGTVGLLWRVGSRGICVVERDPFRLVSISSVVVVLRRPSRLRSNQLSLEGPFCALATTTVGRPSSFIPLFVKFLSGKRTISSTRPRSRCHGAPLCVVRPRNVIHLLFVNVLYKSLSTRSRDSDSLGESCEGFQRTRRNVKFIEGVIVLWEVGRVFRINK